MTVLLESVEVEVDAREAGRRIARGEPVVIVDTELRTDPVLVLAAERADARTVAFFVRHTSGYLAVALPETEADRLDLPALPRRNVNRGTENFSVSVDARLGVSTGISAADRAFTIRQLGSRSSSVDDFCRPGHVVPLRVAEAEPLTSLGRGQSALALMRWAAVRPAAMLADLVSPIRAAHMADVREAYEFARAERLAVVRTSELSEGWGSSSNSIDRIADESLDLRGALFRAVSYVDHLRRKRYDAYVHGRISAGEDVLVALHEDCPTGQLFGALSCDCAASLTRSLSVITSSGRGVLIVGRAEEDDGRDHRRHVRSSPRTDVLRTQILLDLGVRSVRLLTGATPALSKYSRSTLTVLEPSLDYRTDSEWF